jgi:hypothetical protein
MITLYLRKPSELEAFAEKHGLTLEVHACEPSAPHPWYALFADSVTKTGKYARSGSTGYGDTPERAIAEYAECIAGKILVVGMGEPTRREIQCPPYWEADQWVA